MMINKHDWQLYLPDLGLSCPPRTQHRLLSAKGTFCAGAGLCVSGYDGLGRQRTNSPHLQTDRSERQAGSAGPPLPREVLLLPQRSPSSLPCGTAPHVLLLSLEGQQWRWGSCLNWWRV